MMESVEIRVSGSDGIYEVECHFGKFHSSRPCRTVGDILEAVVDSMAAYRLHAEPKETE